MECDGSTKLWMGGESSPEVARKSKAESSPADDPQMLIVKLRGRGGIRSGRREETLTQRAAWKIGESTG